MAIRTDIHGHVAEIVLEQDADHEVLACNAPTRQCLDSQIRNRILRHGQLRKRPVELLEPSVDNRTRELRNPAEVVVHQHRREPTRGSHRTRLDSGWPLLGEQADRRRNESPRHALRCLLI